MSLLDAECSGVESTCREAFTINSRTVDLRIFAEKFVNHRFDAVMSHDSPAVALPFEFGHHESVARSQWQESRCFCLSTWVIVVSMQENHERNTAFSCCLGCFRYIFVPEEFSSSGKVFRTYVSCDAEPVEHYEWLEFGISVLSETLAGIPCMLVVVVAVVPAEQALPCVCNDSLQILLVFLPHHQSKQRLFCIDINAFVTILGSEHGVVSENISRCCLLCVLTYYICRHRRFSFHSFLRDISTDADDAGHIACLSRNRLVDESCTVAYTYNLYIENYSQTVDQVDI